MPLGQLTVFEYLRIYFSMQLQFFFFFELFFLLMQLQFQIFPNYLFMQLQFFFLPELILHKYSVGGYSCSMNTSMSLTTPGTLLRYLALGVGMATL